MSPLSPVFPSLGVIAWNRDFLRIYPWSFQLPKFKPDYYFNQEFFRTKFGKKFLLLCPILVLQCTDRSELFSELAFHRFRNRNTIHSDPVEKHPWFEYFKTDRVPLQDVVKQIFGSVRKL